MDKAEPKTAGTVAPTIISILAILCHTVGVFVLSAITWALLAAWTGSVIYALLLHIVSHPWLGPEALVESLIIFHFVLAALIACCTLIYVSSQWQMDSVRWIHAVVLSLLPFLISLIAYLPVLFGFPGDIFTDYCLAGSSNSTSTSPAWFGYAHALIPQRPNSSSALASYISPDLLASLIHTQRSNTAVSGTAQSLDAVVYPQICPATFNPTCVLRESLLTRLFIKINPFALLTALPLTQRIWCFLYGLIVIAISCIHPVQALIKSLLLRLGVPGRDGGSSWFTHLRLLFSCIFLIFSSICVITYVPEGLAERIGQQVRTNNTQLPNELGQNGSSNIVPRFGSSSKSLKGRQLRIVLCGCQLLLGLVVTLIEYGIYQISRRYPDWGGFRSGLFWTKLISSVIDYLISFISFLTVCWLAIYDSIGLCRLLIIGCYFFFILYPSAVTAYTWLRWRLLARRGMDSLSSPTAAQLAQYQDNCPICYTNMTTEDAKVTRCGHFYHTECLATWMLRQLFCPICHADLLSTKVQNQRRLEQTPAAAVD
ncbi:ERAD-associated E3 ubiquitin-protein ligase HRD1B [Fasciola gigantica]|uniref:ERAD-associated E3 ubiquitin-protein ligase HRD1B n=1 Tax=Fasciola gigantica TaxID=46835 RepID=A0A504YFN5_FASGI|nr:ERAD-associated E3 ubiquitin-protein ligase HRD1B [Fasciola gigantica]